jgi:hypothetical protein
MDILIPKEPVVADAVAPDITTALPIPKVPSVPDAKLPVIV